MPSSDDQDWIFDPSLAAMDRSLRRELRDEAAATEADIQAAELRQRDMSEVLLEYRNRGDVVIAATLRRSFEGFVRYVGSNFLTVVTPDTSTDINTAALDYVKVTRAALRRGGAPTEQAAGTFELRLMEQESKSAKVEIGFRNREEILLGRITTVGQNHVIVIDDHKASWVIPTSAIAFVVRREIGKRR